MTEEMARELTKVILGYRDGANVHPRVVGVAGSDDWSVVTRFGRYSVVPERLRLADAPCACTAPWCASGKVAPGLLDSIRAGHPSP